MLITSFGVMQLEDVNLEKSRPRASPREQAQKIQRSSAKEHNEIESARCGHRSDRT